MANSNIPNFDEFEFSGAGCDVAAVDEIDEIVSVTHGDLVKTLADWLNQK